MGPQEDSSVRREAVGKSALELEPARPQHVKFLLGVGRTSHALTAAARDTPQDNAASPRRRSTSVLASTAASWAMNLGRALRRPRPAHAEMCEP